MPVAEVDDMEVDQKAETVIGKLQIREQLGFMNRVKLLHCLQIDDHRTFDYEIDPIADV